MSSSSPTSTLNVDVRPGKPPMLRVDATDDARAGRPSTATRCVPPSSSTVRFSFAVSGCATWPGPKPSFGG